MSKDNRTIEILQKNLDEDMAWRIRELSILKTKIPPQKGTEQDVLIRAGITTLYAHWEGFNELPRRKRTGYQNQNRLNCRFWCSCRYSLSCSFTYLAIIPSSPCFPTVLA